MPAEIASTTEATFARIAQRLNCLYGEENGRKMLVAIRAMLPEAPFPAQKRHDHWNASDVLLITYGDSVWREGEVPLSTLRDFLRQRVGDAISGVHILPFFPYSSDDGFSVIHYQQVNPELGDWPQIEAIADEVDLAVDLVANHVSRQGLWFADYLSDREPGNRFFIEMDPETDLSQVVRPRSTPLLVPVQTRRGTKHLWATFSEDQLDVDYRQPEVLLTYLRILLHYLRAGARMIRLDAIAFVWKEIGTRCVHLPQTHEVVKLFRDVMSLARPDSLVITETNVPHEENVSYFGQGDEAHLVYQFALPPLLLHALHTGTSVYLNRWLGALTPPPAGCTFLNFTASHDGIGLRPVEGILPTAEVELMIEGMRRFGGYVSMRACADGTETPYEINIALYSAMKGTQRGEDALRPERFVCNQTIMLGLQGIPAFYFHSLVATMNDTIGVEKTGRTRSINRHRWDVDQLVALLDSPTSANARIFEELCRRSRLRRQQDAFHPDAPQTLLPISDAVLAFRREADTQTIVCLHNLTDQPQILQGRQLVELQLRPQSIDLLTDAPPKMIDGQLALQPYQSLWLCV